MDTRPANEPLIDVFKFYLLIDNQQCGPFDQAAIRQMLKLGSVNKETLCWREGLEKWFPLGEVAKSLFITFK
jgi:hypothetical protein